jgi:hypothetical protein
MLDPLSQDATTAELTTRTTEHVPANGRSSFTILQTRISAETLTHSAVVALIVEGCGSPNLRSALAD